MSERQDRYFDREWVWWAVRLVGVPLFAGVAVILYAGGEGAAAWLAGVYAGVSVVNALTQRLAFRNGVSRGATATLALFAHRSVPPSPERFVAMLDSVEPWSTRADIERAADVAGE